MKLIRLLSLSIVATVISITAHAASFAYSYTFDEGNVVTGTFVGAQNGNIIKNISDATVFINGTSIGGIIYVGGFSIPNVWGPTAEGLAVVSIDGTQNNFLFGTSANWTTGQVVSLSYPSWSGIAANWNDKNDTDVPMNSSWSVTDISSVPDAGASVALLGAACALAVLCRRLTKGVTMGP